MAVLLVACGSPAPPPTQTFASPAIDDRAPTPLATKPPAGSVVHFVGWVDESPTIGIWDPEPPVSWRVRALASSGWTDLAVLPGGSMPVTDGATVAAVLDPEGEADVAIGASGKDVQLVVLPSEPWATTWQGILGLVPLPAGGGYLLLGASAVAVLDGQGTLDVQPVPDGYVALAPTSDPGRFLLATAAAASEPYALSEATEFAAYLWTVGSDQQPALVSPDVVAVAPSTVGLAWLRTGDGSWWSVAADETVGQVAEPDTERSVVSPDGRHVLRSSDRTIGCTPAASDPCSVRLIDDSGSVQTFVGPSFGGSFQGNDVGMVLGIRPSLHLPWRLVYGPADRPTTIGIE